MYSSNPTMRPSMRIDVCSYSHTCTGARFCKNLKMRLMGWTITFCTLLPRCAILNVDAGAAGSRELERARP